MRKAGTPRRLASARRHLRSASSTPESGPARAGAGADRAGGLLLAVAGAAFRLLLLLTAGAAFFLLLPLRALPMVAAASFMTSSSGASSSNSPAAGELEDDAPLELVMKDAAATIGKARKGKSRKKAAPAVKSKSKRKAAPATAKSKPPARSAPAPALAGPDSGVEEALRKWRLAEAKRRGVPAFRI